MWRSRRSPSITRPHSEEGRGQSTLSPAQDTDEMLPRPQHSTVHYRGLNKFVHMTLCSRHRSISHVVSTLQRLRVRVVKECLRYHPCPDDPGQECAGAPPLSSQVLFCCFLVLSRERREYHKFPYSLLRTRKFCSVCEAGY